MGLGGYRFVYQNIYPQDDTARRQARDAQRNAEELEERLDRLALLTTALWSLASERLGITEE